MSTLLSHVSPREILALRAGAGGTEVTAEKGAFRSIALGDAAKTAIARGSVSGARSHRRRSLFPAGVAQSSTRSSKLPRLVPSAP